MKYLFLLLFISITALSSAQKEIKFTSLNDALAKPGTATHLTVICNEKEAEKFIRNAKNLKQVTSLRLEGGNASTDWNAIFKAMEHLEWLNELHLSYTEITALSANTDKLCLGNVKITGCSRLDHNELLIRLSHQPSLRSLELSNDIVSLPASISGLQNLNSLTITNSPGLDVETLLHDLQQLPSLERLALNDNELPKLPSSIAKLQKLKMLDISGNYLESLPSSIENLKELDTLIAHDNIFERLQREIEKVAGSGLSYLSVDDDLDQQALAFLQEKAPGVKIKVVEEEFAVSSVSINSPQQAQPRFHKHSMVKPIFPELDKKPEVYQMNALEGGTIFHPGGTKIVIPARSLVDAQGNEITGPVSISYREFHDPVDILFSGIPMTYDSGGVINQFETAGMFELYASQGQNEVFVKQGAKIDVQMVTSDTASSFNFYVLDEKTNNWQIQSNRGLINRPRRTQSTAWRIFQRKLPRNFDPTSFEKRYLDTAYCYTTKKSELAKRKRNRSGKKIYKASSSLYIATVKKEENDPKNIIKFTIKQRNIKRDKRKQHFNYHPEAGVLENMTLVYDGSMSRAEFRNKIIRKRKYNDIRISYTPGSTQVTIELKDQNGFETLTASIYDKDGKLTAGDKARFSMLHKRYKYALKRSQQSFDRELKKKVDLAYFFARRVMTPEEKAIKKSVWIDQQLAMMVNQASVDKARDNITRSFSVSGFGVYNCDQISRLKEPVLVQATYKKSDGVQVPWYTTYVLDKNVRGVLTYSGAYAGVKDGEIALDPSSTQLIMVVDRDGKVSTVKGSEVRKMTFSGDNAEFSVEEFSGNAGSKEELKKLIQMQ